MSTDPKPTGVGDGSPELLIPYPGVEARGGMLFNGLFLGAFAVVSAWVLVLLWRLPEEPGDGWRAVLLTALGLSGATFTAWASARGLIRWWRITRGAWWLRLTASGLEINERLGWPQRYQWRDFERFALVPTPADRDSTELAPQLTHSEKGEYARQHIAGLPVGLVPAFQLVPTYPRDCWHRRIIRLHRNYLYRNYRGPTPDRLVWEFWDRPYDQAVDLLNEWLTRYRNA